MNKLTLTTLLFVFALSCPCFAQDKKDQPAAGATTAAKTSAPAADQKAALPPGMTEEMMAKMKEFTTPGENHKVLDYFKGDWDYSMKFWMDPNSAPEETTGTAEYKWILDGRFVQGAVHGTSMGQPFEGLEILGYDNAKKEYRTIWLDSMGTGIMSASATYDATAKTFTEKGSHSCPLEKTGEKNYRAVLTMTDDDHFKYEFYTTPPGEPTASEFKAMEINYTKKK
jgi:hypothetical protein